MPWVMNMENFKYETSAEETQKPAAIATPVQSIDVVNNLVSILFTYKRSAMYKDIAAIAKLHPSNVSQGLSASRDLGLTELAGRKGLYVLTKEGEEYARLITAGKEGDAQTFLRKVIENNPLWTEIILFLKATRAQVRDPIDLVLDIERKLGKKWSLGMRRRLRASYVSILSYVGLIQKEGDKVISLAETEIEKSASRAKSMPPEKPPPVTPENFATLHTDDFTFAIRKNLGVLEFAKEQFHVWVEYLKRQLSEEQGADR